MAALNRSQLHTEQRHRIPLASMFLLRRWQAISAFVRRGRASLVRQYYGFQGLDNCLHVVGNPWLSSVTFAKLSALLTHILLSPKMFMMD